MRTVRVQSRKQLKSKCSQIETMQAINHTAIQERRNQTLFQTVSRNKLPSITSILIKILMTTEETLMIIVVTLSHLTNHKNIDSTSLTWIVVNH